ncbi:sulfurtransferase TusA family protein [Pseudoroseicyclus tamaricis]|uniref:Sulfurtransferase TusA family protein n=1 Tax=Pseudoroseicyclus tamaricis TaxID=2705421 RepID=A0A6B2JSN8_9RHOB|nr:sulfurtransferase TusA family protein [Pseudoroseicyclus tamaricis]NDV01045.1 sulfurtransferase TusA family protein [Pseudoroseicyclus tamaricis]
MSEATPEPVEIDARGLRCPLPVLRLRKVLQTLPEGGTARLIADDPMAVLDVPHFAQEAGHEIIEMTRQPNSWLVRRGCPAGSRGS